MAINSKIHIIFFIFLTNNVHFLKILLDNLIFFLFPKFLELFLGAVAPLGLAMSVRPSVRPLTLLKYELYASVLRI